MSVDSYLELFTSLFGWTFYGILWDVLVSTGIVYLPFLGILIDNWREPAQGGEVGHASGLSLRYISALTEPGRCHAACLSDGARRVGGFAVERERTSR